MQDLQSLEGLGDLIASTSPIQINQWGLDCRAQSVSSPMRDRNARTNLAYSHYQKPSQNNSLTHSNCSSIPSLIKSMTTPTHDDALAIISPKAHISHSMQIKMNPISIPTHTRSLSSPNTPLSPFNASPPTRTNKNDSMDIELKLPIILSPESINDNDHELQEHNMRLLMPTMNANYSNNNNNNMSYLPEFQTPSMELSASLSIDRDRMVGLAALELSVTSDYEIEFDVDERHIVFHEDNVNHDSICGDPLLHNELGEQRDELLLLHPEPWNGYENDEDILLPFNNNNNINKAITPSPISPIRLDLCTQHLQISQEFEEFKEALYARSNNAFVSSDFANYPNFSDNKHDMNLNVIGSGSFGIVIKSFHIPSCQTVAIKMCRSNESEMVKSFTEEFLKYSEFTNCAFIVNTLAFGRNENDNKLCIALEYMNMSSLAKLDVSILNKSHIQYMCFAILSALNALHSKSYVHNDVKPGNILINRRGLVKLSDFGCIQKMNENKTRLCNIVGSKFYFAPEKRRECPSYNCKSDIWSFGITLYELINNTHNENNNSVSEFGYSTAPKLCNRKYDDDLCDFVSKMLAENDEMRWSALQLLKHPYLASLTTSLKPIRFAPKIQNEEDLSFMVDTLIKHYSNRHFYDEHCGEMYSDKEKIANLSLYSGLNEEEVKHLIKIRVSRVKREFHKSWNHSTSLKSSQQMFK